MPLQILIDNALAKKQAERVHIGSQKYKPSNFGRCYRLQLLARLDIPISNPPDIKALKRMEQGKRTHELNQSYLPGEMCEVRIETEDCLGFADFEEPDKISDIKSCDEYVIKRYWNKPIEILLKTKFENWLQVGWYGLEKKKGFVALLPTPFGCFIKDECVIPIEAIKEDVEKEIIELKKHWEVYQKEKKLPDPIPRAFNGNDCTYCSWKIYCDNLMLQGK